MLPVLFRIPDWIPVLGGQAITSFGTLLLGAFLIGGGLFVRRLRSADPGSAGWDLVVTAAVAGLVGAKLTHLAVHGVLGLPSGGLGRGGLDWFGGLGLGGAAVLWQARRQGLELSLVAGAAAAPLALGYAVGRVGSFMVGADYGVPTALPWGMSFPAGAPPTTPGNLVGEFGASIPPGTRDGDYVRVHPTQLYEAALSLGVYGVLEWVRVRRNAFRVGGWRLFGLYLVLAGGARVAVELVRLKRDRIAGPITVDLLLAFSAVAVGVALRSRRKREAHPNEVT